MCVLDGQTRHANNTIQFLGFVLLVQDEVIQVSGLLLLYPHVQIATIK